jgi:phage shock protein A
MRFFMISSIVTGIVVVLGIILVFNLRAFKTLFGVGKAQAGKLARAAEGLDPVAMYKEKIEEATDNLRTAKESLVRVKGLIASVERQVNDGKSEIARLDARIKLALTDNNEAKAAEYVTQLQSAKTQLKQNEEQLATHNSSYQAFLKQVQAAQAKIINAKREAEKLGTQLEISKVEAEIGDINQRFSSKADPLDEALKYKEGIQKQIDQNKARGQVLADVNTDLVEEDKEEARIKDLEAKALLDEYKKNMNPTA